MMDVFYYYYYLLYKKIWDVNPRLAATLAVTTLIGYSVIVIIDILLIRFFCIDMSKYLMLAVFAIALLINEFYFFTSKKVKAIIRARPMFFNNHRLTIWIVLIVSLFVIAIWMWAGANRTHILRECRIEV